MASRNCLSVISRALAASCAMLGVALLPGTAHAALKVTKAGPAPVVLAPGASLTVKASATGGSGKLSIVLASTATSPAGGTLLTGKGARVATRAKSVTVRGTVPASLPAGQQRYVLVCAAAAKAVAGKKASCKSAGRAPTSSADLAARLEAAKAAGALAGGKDVMYALWAMNKDSRLPSELQGATTSQSSEALVRDAMVNFDRFTPQVKRQIAWYFAPPSAPGSPWAQKLVKQKPKQQIILKPGAKAARAATTTTTTTAAATAPTILAAAAKKKTADCSGYNYLSDSPYAEGYKSPWVGIPTSDGHTIVWYQDGEAKAKATAEQYAAAMPEVWQKLTAEFGAPPSDAGMECYSGPDGRFDVYVNGAIVFQAAGGLEGGRGALGTHGIAMTYPSSKGQWCTGRPSWIALRAGESNWALAHEFMHAIQYAHKYASCAEPIAWWDEGSATWAADFVYPTSEEERQFGDWITDPLGQRNLGISGYRAYPFWMYLQRTYGTGVLRAMFDQLRTKGSIEAADAAIPGGLGEQFPKFAISLWNQSPIGESGFPISQSFKDWDHWETSIPVPSSPDLTLDGAAEKTIDLPIQNAAATAPLSVASYHRVKITDDKVREVKFTNGAAGGSAHVQAMLHLQSGEWKLDDWTGKDKTLCRDQDEENVTELIIVTTNASGTGSIPAFTHKLRGRDQCEPVRLKITSYHEKTTSDTSGPVNGHDVFEHQSNGAGDPVLVDPCPSSSSSCKEEGEVYTRVSVPVTTTVSGYVNGTPSDTLCPGGHKDLPTQTLSNTERMLIEFDPRQSDGDAIVNFGAPTPSVGGVDINYCQAYTWGSVYTDATQTVPRKQVLSGTPFTVSHTETATIPAYQGASSSISYTWSIEATIVRVTEDGTPYSG
ncbi:MAG: hypothetical protein QM679_11455 [Patulibacter sp.]